MAETINKMYEKMHKGLGCEGCRFVDSKWLFKAPACTYPGKLTVDNETGACLSKRVKPDRKGYKYWDKHEDGGIAWAVFNNPNYPSTLEDVERELGWHSHYGGVGQAYADKPFIRHGRTRTLVTQMTGLDI